MAFLAPLFLAGLAVLALPILLHLQKNKPKQTVPFSSLMFLEASPLVTKRRARLQDLILLLLRCLALILLVLAFARPFLPAPKTPTENTDGAVLNVLLIDTSASMRGEPMERALAEAEKIIADVAEKDWIAVGTFSGKFQPLLSAARARELASSERKPAALAALATVSAGWEGTVLDSALLATVASIDEGLPSKIHLIGDFQKDQAIERLTSEVWPATVQVIPYPITSEGPWTNVGLTILANTDEDIRVRLVNSEGSEKSEFVLKWSGVDSLQNVSVPPGESAVFEAPEGVSSEGEVRLSGDDFAFDNSAHWAAKVRPLARIWYPDEVSAADPNESLYFLARAMNSTPDYEVEIVSDFPKPDPALAITGGPSSEESITKLSEFITQGGTALLSLEDNGSAQTLARLLEKEPAPITEVNLDPHTRFGEINFESPVFAPFADARYSDFSSILIWKYRTLPPALTEQGTAVASFASGDPAWLVYPLGQGTLHVLTTTWRPSDGQIALTTKFPPLLHSLLTRAADAVGEGGPIFVGDSIPFPAEVSTITLPDGKEVAASSVISAESPGIYRAGETALAVQLDPNEFELTTLSRKELSALGLPLKELGDAALLAEIAEKQSNTDQEREQKWGWWLILAAAVFFLAETIYAAVSGRRPNLART